MGAIDVVLIVIVIALALGFFAILARQRFMLRTPGAIPVAIGVGPRWSYGVARFVGDELRLYKALGLGTRPTRRLLRASLVVDSHRAPSNEDLRSLPSGAVVVDCHDDGGPLVLGMGRSAYTGFVSWLEAAAPRA